MTPGTTAGGRFGVPHSADGPKVSLGVLWFLCLMAAALTSPLLVIVVLVPVAGAAAYQAAQAWHPGGVDPVLGAALAALVVGSGAAGSVALGAISALAALAAGLHGFVIPRPAPLSPEPWRAGELLLASGWPVGVAGGSLLVLAGDYPQAFVSLVLLVSAYEMGDFLVGVGTSNAYEGPIAGLVALGLVAVALHFVLPHPFTAATMPVFGALAGVCAVLGQVAASALLPVGGAWAPGLRRLDSYLIAAPLWVLLIG